TPNSPISPNEAFDDFPLLTYEDLILFTLESGRQSIEGYYCSCIHGRRTIESILAAWFIFYLGPDIKMKQMHLRPF
ncbi:hypothetical protein HF086_008566, partial [Spodoptera exigua]